MNLFRKGTNKSKIDWIESETCVAGGFIEIGLNIHLYL